MNYIFAIILVILTVLVLRLLKRINLFYPYQRDHDDIYSFNGDIAQYVIQIDEKEIILPQLDKNIDSAFLEMKIKSRLLGKILSPSLEIHYGEHKVIQYFEPGVSGKRYINISSLIKSYDNEKNISLKGNGIHWDEQLGQLIAFNNPDVNNKRILIISPHPDDAEIAAFGLYSTTDSYIITITAGERGRNIFSSIIEDEKESFIEKGIARTVDSITIPLLGKVRPDKCWNLGYFARRLYKMYKEPEKAFSSEQTSVSNISNFRDFNVAELPESSGESSWVNLVEDLSYLIAKISPDIIVTPHPALDFDTDHQFSTMAVIEAIEKANLTNGYLFLYTNHELLTSVYPFGPNNAIISLPPCRNDNLLFDTVLSYSLNQQTQTRKLIALESMHDLRHYDFRIASDFKDIFRNIRENIRRFKNSWKVEGTDFYRRGPRPNELFFVLSYSKANSLRERFINNRIVNFD